MATRVRPPGTTSARGRPAAAVLAVGALAVLLWGGYGAGWSWTGFGDNDSLWDWLHLLLLPVAVAALPLWLTRPGALHPRRRRAAELGAAGFALLVVLGYLVPMAWTGFPGNRLWDWLELVLLPAALVVAPLWPQLRPRLRRHHRILLALAGGRPGGARSSWATSCRCAGPASPATRCGTGSSSCSPRWPSRSCSSPPRWPGWRSRRVEAPASPEAAAAPAPAGAGRRGVVPALAAALLALAAGLVVGHEAFGRSGDATATPAGAPARDPASPAACIPAAGRVLHRGGALYACSDAGRLLALGPGHVDVVRSARAAWSTRRRAAPARAARPRSTSRA